MAPPRFNIVVAIASVYSVVATLAAPAKEPVLPQFSEVHAVESHFAEPRDRGAHNLISRLEVERALDEVKELGWDVQDREKIWPTFFPISTCWWSRFVRLQVKSSCSRFLAGS